MARESKESQILIRVHRSEKAAFQDAAELAGIPMSAWVRERLRCAARKDLMEANLPVAFIKLKEPDNVRN